MITNIPTTKNKLNVGMGRGLISGGIWNVANTTIMTQLKMEMANIFFNVTKYCYLWKIIRTKRGGPSKPFIPHRLLAQARKKPSIFLFKYSEIIIPIHTWIGCLSIIFCNSFPLCGSLLKLWILASNHPRYF